MVKSFLIFISLQIFLYAREQIILVIADDINLSKAKMWCFEDGKKVFGDFDVNIGKNGLGAGLGEIELKGMQNIVKKYEGDKKAPIGIFKLTSVFGYERDKKLKMPYIYANKDLICVDDSKHKHYNQIINIPDIKPDSFEYMKRDDEQYKLGIVVKHNKNQIPKRGSCIFIHIQKSKDTPTAGCTSMSYDDIKKLTSWLDKEKNPLLIQIPSSMLDEVKYLYPFIKRYNLR